MEVTIRLLEEHEKNELDRVYISVLNNEFPTYSEKLRTHFTTGSYKDVMFSLPLKFGAFVENKLVGFLLANPPMGGVIFVQWIGVLREYQHKGIGKQLLLTIEQYGKEHGSHNIFLEAEEEKKDFYLKHDYIQFGYNEKGWYGLSNYLLKKVLQEPEESSFLVEN